MPSQTKLHSTVMLRYGFIAVLALIIIIRSIFIFLFGEAEAIGSGVVLLMMLISFGVPIYGIIGVIQNKSHNYKFVGIMLSISIFNAVKDGQISAHWESFLFLIPNVIAIGLAFYIPFLLKTAYKKVPVINEVGGVEKTSIGYEFEELLYKSDEIID